MSEEDGDFNVICSLVVCVWGGSYAYDTRMAECIRVWAGLEEWLHGCFVVAYAYGKGVYAYAQ